MREGGFLLLELKGMGKVSCSLFSNSQKLRGEEVAGSSG